MATYEKQLARLLADFGYEVQGNRIIQRGIAGWCGPRIVCSCRSILDATEQLIPIVREDEFSRRYRAIVRTN